MAVRVPVLLDVETELENARVVVVLNREVEVEENVGEGKEGSAPVGLALNTEDVCTVLVGRDAGPELLVLVMCIVPVVV